jgi:hypothetical protein
MKKIITTLFIITVITACTGLNREPSSVNENSTILYIGDSQSAGFLGGLVFHELSNRFKEEHINVYGVGSSSPRHWADSIKGKSGKWLCDSKRRGRFNKNYQIDLKSRICNVKGNESIYGSLNSKKPDYVVFQFLGNSMNQSNKSIDRNIKSLLGNLGNQECLFVTSPPFYHGDVNPNKTNLSKVEKKYISLIEKNKHRLVTENRIINAVDGRCTIVRGMIGNDMIKFSHDRENYAGDAIHLSRKGAANFLKHFKNSLP